MEPGVRGTRCAPFLILTERWCAMSQSMAKSDNSAEISGLQVCIQNTDA